MYNGSENHPATPPTMTDVADRLQRWSWHQSHDQATVLLNVPLDLDERDFSVSANAMSVSHRRQGSCAREANRLQFPPLRFILTSDTLSLPFEESLLPSRYIYPFISTDVTHP